MTLRIMALSITKICHYAECAECRDLFIGMLNVVMLSVVRLNVVRLSVVAPIIKSVYRLNLFCADICRLKFTSNIGFASVAQW